MPNERQGNTSSSSDRPPPIPDADNSLVGPESTRSGDLSTEPAKSLINIPPDQLSVVDISNSRRTLLSPLQLILLGLAGLFLLGGGVLVFKAQSYHRSQVLSGSFNTIKLPLSKLSSLKPNANNAQSLDVNGQLKVASSVLLAGTKKPVDPQSGQLYYDQTTNKLGYFNGSGFVYLQGGAASSTTNVYNGSTIYNITNSGGGNGVSSSGTSGHISLFTGTSTIGNAVITQSGTDLTVGSISGSASTAIQAGTNGISILTSDQSGTSGNVTIKTGASSTTAAGDVTIDTGPGVINGTVIANKNFEDSTTDYMGNCFGFTATMANSTAEAHSGTHSLSTTMGGDGSYCAAESTPYHIVAQAGHSYRFSAWIRAGSTARTFTFETEFSSTGYSGGGSLGIYQWGTVTDSSSTWKQVSGTLVAPAGTIDLGIQFYSTSGIPSGEVHYVDDITVTDLNSALAVSQLNLGATNAQQVTVGNLNQIGATTIDGSGIDINGNLGVTNISSGFINITGSGTSNITSGGTSALTIRSGGSASWGVADSLYGGSLTLHAGSSGGNNNGGNIIIQSGAGAGTGVSGNITIDTQLSPVSGTIVDSRGFESGTDNMTAWYGDTVAQTNTVAGSGSYSLEETGTGGNWGVIENFGTAGAPITAGHKYFFSAYVRANSTPQVVGSSIAWTDSGGTSTGGLTLNSATETSINWYQITGTGTAPAGTTQSFWIFTGSAPAGEIQYFDELTVTDLSSSAATSDLNLGSTYAQVINIGNMNQVGLTTIQGGSGIDLESGASNLSISGGTIDISGTYTILKPKTDSTAAIEIQNSSGTPLFTADTTSNNIDLGTDTGLYLSGANAVISNSHGCSSCEAFGAGATIINADTTAVGSSALAQNSQATAVGANANANSAGATALGAESIADFTGTAVGSYAQAGNKSVALGNYANYSAFQAGTNTHNSIAIGADANNIAANQLVIGGSTAAGTYIQQAYLGSGVEDATPVSIALHATSACDGVNADCTAAVNDTAGADLSLASGQGTGTGNGGNINFQVAKPAAASGSALNALATVASISGVNGSVLFKNSANSASAFVIQNATGTSLLAADTSTMTITIQNLVVSANITINGHIITGGSTPGIAAGAAATCSGGGSVGVTGNDTSGTVSITTGTGPCSVTGGLLNVTFSSAYASTPHVLLTPAGPNAASIQYYYTSSTSGFTVSTGTVPASTTTYNYSYLVVQ